MDKLSSNELGIFSTATELSDVLEPEAVKYLQHFPGVVSQKNNTGPYITKNGQILFSEQQLHLTH